MQLEATVLGLMSGSSLDGLDLAIGRFFFSNQSFLLNDFSWELLDCRTVPLSGKWKAQLQSLPHQSALKLVEADVLFGQWMGQQVNEFIADSDHIPELIVSHGHTIFHFPHKGISTQIGCGAHLSATTGIPVLNNLRMLDIAYGGQGAPLAPISDLWLFRDYDFFLNLGGIANLSFRSMDQIIGYDIVGANQILNRLAQEIGQPYDQGGQLASTGTIIPELLDRANAIPYLSKNAPKSLGNDEVEQEWVQLFLEYAGLVNDKLHTACVHIAQVIAREILSLATENKNYRLLPTGGGAYNTFLIQCIREAVSKSGLELEINLPDSRIIEYKEALLMALMGFLKLHGLPNCLSQVTGARLDSSSGSFHGNLAKWIR